MQQRANFVEYPFLFSVILIMLLILEDTHEENVEKLFAFAKENHLQLSVVDEDGNYSL